MAYFPNNTVANFRVKLAETIDLPGQWEVALVGLHYPHTWPTIKKGVQQTFLYNPGAGLKDETAILKEVYYPSLDTPGIFARQIAISPVRRTSGYSTENIL